MLLEKVQLEPGEEVLRTVRKHWFIIVSQLFGTFLMLFLPFFILILIALFPEQLLKFDFSIAHYTALIIFAVTGWTIVCLMAGFATWTHYYLDLWIITDRRIIFVDQISFFNRNVSIFRLERLQDIEFYVKGLIPTLLNFGTLKAQTASAFEGNFISDGLPDPRGIQATIQKAVDQRLALLHNNPDLL